MEDSSADAITWRRKLHRIPELLYDLPLTSSFVVERLREFGVDSITTGVGKSGVVATIKGRKKNGKSVGLRADMDALPITELTNHNYQSNHPGRMHACGHDGHTAILLGAARKLSADRDFAGTAVLLFQPAEEGGAGAKAMIDDGVLDRFKIDEIYGLHNMPGISSGSFGFRSGAIMAASDTFSVRLHALGGHAAAPHLSDDIILAGASLVQSLQQIVARNVNPLEAAVLSVSCFNSGTAENILPSDAILRGTVRALGETTREAVQTRLHTVAQAVGLSHNVNIKVDYTRQYPVTVNTSAQTEVAASVARELVGTESVDAETAPQLASEDFAYFLQKRPGAFLFVGNGDSAPLHNPTYDFNDAIISTGIRFWCALMKASSAA